MPVLTSVDLAVDAGEVVVLLGPNGAGKTTLLRMLALLLAPTGGRLLLFGTDATRAPAALRRRIGYAGHEISCYPDLSGAENLAFYARLFGVSEAAAPIASRLAILHRGRIAWVHDGRAADAAVIVAAYRAVVAERV